MQLNTNAYWILISCFVFWAKPFYMELPFSVFQNLYRLKTAPSSIRSYYFQGYQGTFIASCQDSDKNYKYLWFYAKGEWLSGRIDFSHVSLEEHISLTFKRGYVWT